MSVYKRGKYWIVQFNHGNKTYTRSSKSTRKRDALELERQLLAHLTFEFQRIPLPGRFRAAGVRLVAVIKLNNPVFASFVYAHLLSP